MLNLKDVLKCFIDPGPWQNPREPMAEPDPERWELVHRLLPRPSAC